MLYVLLKHLLLLILKKLIRINKLLFLTIETYMHVACFIKTFIVILSKMHVAFKKKKKKNLLLIYLKKLIRTSKL